MARFSRLEVLNETLRIGMVPTFYHPDLETSKRIVEACAAGGARVVEYMNRGDNAHRVFSDLVVHFAQADPSVILGAGSVLDPATAALYISSGANFIVGSVFNPEVARVCNRRKVAYMPGCGSASEISEAEEAGVEICKIFPAASVGGPDFVRALLGPTPWSRIMPTGAAVEATRENIQAWFKAGVAAVGIGGNLLRPQWLEAQDWASISRLAAQVIGWIREARGGSLYLGVEHPGLYPYGGATGREIAEWYSRAFGFRMSEGTTSFFVAGPGPGRIEVLKEGGTDRSHVAIEVADFEAAMADLQAKGFEFETPKILPDVKAVFLKQTDPAGNRVHLIWRR